MKTGQINIRVDDEMIAALDHIQDQTMLSRTEIIRRLLLQAYYNGCNIMEVSDYESIGIKK